MGITPSGALGMAAASTLATMTTVALRRQMWEDKLYLESLHDDIFFSDKLTETIDITSSERPSIPNALWMNVKALNGARSVNVPFMKAFNGAAVEGNNSNLIGTEETVALKQSAFHANDYFKAVATLKYGIDYRELEPYKVWEKVQPGLSRWLAEYRGYGIRMAYLQSISHNLAAAPISITAHWNPNMFVANVNPDNQPVYESTLGTYAEAIGDALFLATAQKAATAASAVMNLKMLNQLQWYASDKKRIMPIKIGGKMTYLVVIPSIQMAAFKDPSRSNSGMELVKAMAHNLSPDDNLFFSNGLRWDKLLLVEDQRYPTLVLGGTMGSWTLTAGYEKQGRTDTRTTTTDPSVFTCGTLIGAGSMVNLEPEKPHFTSQVDNYQKNQGEAIAGAFGYEVPIWDLDTPTAATAQQESSIELVMATPSFTA